MDTSCDFRGRQPKLGRPSSACGHGRGLHLPVDKPTRVILEYRSWRPSLVSHCPSGPLLARGAPRPGTCHRCDSLVSPRRLPGAARRSRRRPHRFSWPPRHGCSSTFRGAGQALSHPAAGSLHHASLRALLRGKLRARELAVLGQGDAATADDGDVKQRRLVREIEATSRRRLAYAGRQYRLVADSHLGSLADRDDYEVVRHQDAVPVLGALAGQGSDRNLARLLTEAARMLAQDSATASSSPMASSCFAGSSSRALTSPIRDPRDPIAGQKAGQERLDRDRAGR